MGRERGVVGSAGSLAEKAVNLYGSALYVGHVYYFHELFFQLHIALQKNMLKQRTSHSCQLLTVFFVVT